MCYQLLSLNKRLSSHAMLWHNLASQVLNPRYLLAAALCLGFIDCVIGAVLMHDMKSMPWAAWLVPAVFPVGTALLAGLVLECLKHRKVGTKTRHGKGTSCEAWQHCACLGCVDASRACFLPIGRLPRPPREQLLQNCSIGAACMAAACKISHPKWKVIQLGC